MRKKDRKKKKKKVKGPICIIFPVRDQNAFQGLNLLPGRNAVTVKLHAVSRKSAFPMRAFLVKGAASVCLLFSFLSFLEKKNKNKKRKKERNMGQLVF